MKMNRSRAKELLIPLKNGKATGISQHWKDRLIEALEYVIEHESAPCSKSQERVTLLREWFPNMDAE